MIGRGDRWYKDAVVYSLDVETFQDSDGDGVGDFPGLTARLDHLAALGVTCVWLLPFYPTPNRDNGYDVVDYYGVDPRLGTLGDFVDCVREARERGIRVLVDLVVNHTSDRHPWFQAARADPRSRYRDYYVWSKDKPADAHEGMVFPGVQTTVWSYDERAGEYFLHRFYPHQPDLNFTNPAVREEVRKVMGFWLELGVSGFRVDAAPFVVETKGVRPSEVDVGDPMAYLHHMREFLTGRRGDAVLLAEANVEMAEIPSYAGPHGPMHLLFNFLTTQHLFLALARQHAAPLADAFGLVPALPTSAQWANFLRNHDELDLARLTDAERQEVFDAFAPEPHMQAYGRGIRRRLAPMLGPDRRREEMAYALMLALPGTPVLRYGDEIGMGDDLSQPERESVRTPMQWTGEANGGFSTADAARLVRPVIAGGEYGYERVNVAAQQRDPGSLLNWLARALRVRRECPELAWGRAAALDAGAPGVFAHRCDWEGGTVVAAHNLADRPCDVTLDLGGEFGAAPHVLDLLGDGSDEPPAPAEPGEPSAGGARLRAALGGYGYRWWRVRRAP